MSYLWDNCPKQVDMFRYFNAQASAFVTATSLYRVFSSFSDTTVSGNAGHDRMDS